MTLTVRPATDDDRRAIERVRSVALSEPSPDVLVDGLVAPETALVAEDGPVVGYVLVVLGDPAAYVPELAVRPSRQGEGVGTELLAALCERLRADGIERVRLTARADDDRARGFYDARGFEVVGREPDHYADGADGIVYARSTQATV